MIHPLGALVVRRFLVASAALLLAGCSSETPPSAKYGDNEFTGSWALLATDVDGNRVYLDRDEMHDAGDRKVVDLGYVGASGRRLMRMSFGCADNSIISVSSFGDDVSVSVDLVGDLPHEPGEHSIADYVCGRAKVPVKTISILPGKA